MTRKLDLALLDSLASQSLASSGMSIRQAYNDAFDGIEIRARQIVRFHQELLPEHLREPFQDAVDLLKVEEISSPDLWSLLKEKLNLTEGDTDLIYRKLLDMGVYYGGGDGTRRWIFPY